MSSADKRSSKDSDEIKQQKKMAQFAIARLTFFYLVFIVFSNCSTTLYFDEFSYFVMYKIIYIIIIIIVV